MKNRVKIYIDGKSFTLMGPESEEHIRSVAAYIDKKIKEIRETAQMGSQDRSLAYILTSLNVGDDYFKEVERSLNLEADIEELKLKILGKETELEKLRQKVQELTQKLEEAEALQKESAPRGNNQEKQRRK